MGKVDNDKAVHETLVQAIHEKEDVHHNQCYRIDDGNYDNTQCQSNVCLCG